MNTEVSRSVGIMQPYVFPYIGYYQLAHAVDHFVFYDDVQYKKGGWINRNRVTHRGEARMFTLPVQGRSLGSQIRQVSCGSDRKWVKNLIKTLRQEYLKAPHYEAVADLVFQVLNGSEGQPISKVAIQSVKIIFDYLGLSLEVLKSSETFPNERGLRKSERVIDIVRKNGANCYINLPGGANIYSAGDFAEHNLTLRFIRNQSEQYSQFKYDHVPHLSIIDVLMHNTPEEARKLLNQFEVVEPSDI